MLLRNVLQGRPQQLLTLAPAAPIEEVMGLFVEKNLCCLPVVEAEGKPVGMIKGLDILSAIRRAKGDYTGLKVKDVMRAISVEGKLDDDTAFIANLMEKKNICHIPVVKGEKMVGFFSLQDIYRMRMEDMEAEIHTLTDMLNKRDKSGDYDSFA
jgi:predicted transcriptional regulator